MIAPRIDPTTAGNGDVELGTSVCAFLDMIAFTEGTDNNRQPTADHGYDVIVGGALFADYTDHPNKLVRLSPSLSSTAAGRYQILYRYWVVYKARLKLPDFSPMSQDLYAIQQLRERGALPMLKAGRFEDAVLACNNIWASLPDSPHGQHTYSMDEAKGIYAMHNGFHNN